MLIAKHNRRYTASENSQNVSNTTTDLSTSKHSLLQVLPDATCPNARNRGSPCRPSLAQAQKQYPPMEGNAQDPACIICVAPETLLGATSLGVQTAMPGNSQAQSSQPRPSIGWGHSRIVDSPGSAEHKVFVPAGFARDTGVWVHESRPQGSRPQPQVQGSNGDASDDRGPQRSQASRGS